MALSKAELEEHRERYYLCLLASKSARADGRFCAALTAATESWDYVDGMMQFERKYERKETSSKDHEGVETIDIALQLAPVLFDHSSLARLGELLRTQRRIDRNTTDDLKAKHAAAVRQMWLLRRVWALLEDEPQLDSEAMRKRIGIQPDDWDRTVNCWESIGVLQREGNPSKLRLATQMKSTGFGKCPCCGVRVKGSKSKLLEPLVCPKCKSLARFVLVAPLTPTTKE